RGLLAALQRQGEGGRAVLAFLLARELGHVALGHCRRGYQLLEIERGLRRGLVSKAAAGRLRPLLGTTVAVAGRLVTLLYTREQHDRADLFALHLCRNAGFDLDGALDDLRRLAAAQHPGVAAGAAARAAGPLLAYYLSVRPDPLRRLKRLLQERDGVVEGSGVGLLRYDPRTRRLEACAAGARA